MSNRVEEQDRQALDAERLQKRIDRETREAKTGKEGAARFEGMMKGNQTARDQAGRQQKGNQSKAEGEKKGAAAQKSQTEGERKAMLARGGTVQGQKLMEQARSFQGVLGKQQEQTADSNKGLTKARDTGTKDTRVEVEGRTRDIEKKELRTDGERATARVEARDRDRPNAAIEGDASGDSSGQQQQRQDRGGAHIPKPVAGVQATQQASTVREVKQIPPEMLERLASAVRIGINDKGLHELQIDLKEGVLQGASLRVTAEGGKVTLTFSGLSGHTKNLVESSAGELMRRLDAKGFPQVQIHMR